MSCIDCHCPWLSDLSEIFADTKGVIRICKSKKDRQHNGQEKNSQKDKRLSKKNDTEN
jgi:hypothetical protein